MIDIKQIRMVQSNIGCAKIDCVKLMYTLMLGIVKTKSLRLLVSIIKVRLLQEWKQNLQSIK